MYVSVDSGYIESSCDYYMNGDTAQMFFTLIPDGGDGALESQTGKAFLDKQQFPLVY